MMDARINRWQGDRFEHPEIFCTCCGALATVWRLPLGREEEVWLCLGCLNQGVVALYRATLEEAAWSRENSRPAR